MAELTRDTLSPNIQRARLVEGDRFAYIQGNGVCIHDLKTGEKETIPSENYGFSMIETNHKHGQLLIAEYGLNPNVYRYDHMLKLVHVFEGAYQLDIEDMVISYRGRLVLLVTGTPHYDFRLLDLKTNEILNVEECKVPQGYITAAFNPNNDFQLAVLTNGAVFINEIHKTYRQGTGDDKVAVFYEIEQRQIEFEKSTEQFTALAWHHDNTLFLGTNSGTCFQLQSDTNKVIHKIETGSMISHFLLSQLHLIVMTSTNEILLYEKNDKGDLISTSPSAAVQTVPSPPTVPSPSSIYYNHSLTQIYMFVSQKTERAVQAHRIDLMDDENSELDSLSQMNTQNPHEKSVTAPGIISSEPHYSHSLNHIFRLDLPAEKYDYDKDPGDGAAEEEANLNIKTYNPSFSHVAVGHSSPVVLVQDIKIGDKVYLVSIGTNGQLLAYEISSEGEVRQDTVVIGDLQGEVSVAKIDSLGRIWVGTSTGCLKWFWIENASETQEDSQDEFSHLGLKNQTLKVSCGFAKRLKGFLDSENQTHSSRMKTSKPKSAGQVLDSLEMVEDNLVLDKLEISSDSVMVAICFKNSRRLIFVSGQADYEFGFVGYSDLIGTVESFAFSNKIKSPIPDTHNYMVEVCLKNGMLLAVLPPQNCTILQTLEKLADEDVLMFGRRIDEDLKLISIDQASGEVWIAGEQLVLNKYEQPNEFLPNMDKKVRQPFPPVSCVEGHDLPSSCFDYSTELGMIISGSKDGTILLLNPSSGESEIFQSQNHKSGGVSSLSVSRYMPLIYSGGFDGSVIIYGVENGDSLEFNVSEIEQSLKDCASVQDFGDHQITNYLTKLRDARERDQIEAKQNSQREMKAEFNKIKKDLQSLLRKNDQVDEIERLDRDDFCLDVALRDDIMDKATKEEQRIRKTAELKNLREQLYQGKIEHHTYKCMDTRLRTLTGLVENTLIMNYVIRKKDTDQERKLKLLKNMRMIELKEKEWKKEHQIPEYIDLRKMTTRPIKYVVNAYTGKQDVILIDHTKQEEDRQQIRMMVNTDNDPKRNQANPDDATDRPECTGYRLKRLKRHQRKQQKQLGVQMTADEVMDNEEDDENNPEDGDGTAGQDWDYMYGALELFTSKRKRMQIMLVRNLILKIKKRFNKEFERYVKLRNDQIEQIMEKNVQIQELLEKLERVEANFESKPNIIENPNLVLQVQDHEVGVKPYTTKKELARLEAKRIAEEEHRRKLQSDDAGNRALKQMMNNTLEEKKVNQLVEELVEEEWMKKPEDEMSNEEKTKLEEFKAVKAKLEEEKMKIRKKLEQELSKLKNKIKEICQNFDRKIFILFTKRLEYTYRIYEQEMYIIKLSQSLFDEKSNQQYLSNLDLDIQLREDVMKEKEQFLYDIRTLEMELKNLQQQRQNQLQTDNYPASDTTWKYMKQQLINKYTFVFECFTGDEFQKQRRGISNPLTDELEKNFLEKSLSAKMRLNECDAFYELERKMLKKEASLTFDVYIDDLSKMVMSRHKPEDSVNIDGYIESMRAFFELSREVHEAETEKNELFNFITDLERDEKLCASKLQEFKMIRENLAQSIITAQSNINLQMRFTKSFVEIDMIKIETRLHRAVLVNQDVIRKKNHIIQELGKIKVEQLKESIEHKNRVEDFRYEVITKDLDIEDLIIESMAITRLKVTKQLQAALAKNETHMSETEEKNIINQKKELKEATKKRIGIYKAKERGMKKEIEFLAQENHQLNFKGAKLMETVNQRQEIFYMMQGKQNAEKEDENVDGKLDAKQQNADIAFNDNSGYKRAMQISKNRKLFDNAKQLAQEFELLVEELKKLKARTFPQIPSRPNNFL